MTTTTLPAARTVDDRGELVISDRTVERIATQAVTELDGVGGSATRMLGVAVGGEDLDRSAKVTAQVHDDTVTLDVRLSISYPRSVAKTTEAAREHLRSRITELTGLAVSRVDITVTALHTAAAEPRRVL
ncbi:Asp23/Gls24 family envelope stress response protein [Amycolatopsis sp. PS_44_ISF1]|uniref:Asp23/Gls24 family envelope stress response protein n=1 Tax=Amycolatopsis sp. PS_44_ISF1 TaxID=2974917 RepID=UPI0028DE1002|nr:Asp23/Gls24 family envelope stress response protein [Amycolatopsis sp. PS_44_ISF1]MDT8910022.1 Asp23/Gls24 family envelope stress response protein [Amycolatopsis sp. PS_44_ISF1]